MTQTALVFPGQGSQSVGMLVDVAHEHPIIQQTFEEASDALHFDLWAMTKDGPAAHLDQTENTQPALLAGGVAMYRLLTKHFPVLKTARMAGHSLGEYTALVCANAISYHDALRLVAARGRFMQAAVPSGVGAMAAIIGLSNDDVAQVCEEAKQANEVLSPANFNSVGQVVIAGHAASVNQALVIAKAKGAKMAVLIPVSVPSHCALMHPAALQLKQLLETITMTSPQTIVINNIDVEVYTTVEQMRDGLTQQLEKPVRWVETIQAFQAAGVTQIIECGPGKVLTGLIKRIDKSLSLASTADLASVNAVLAASVGV